MSYRQLTILENDFARLDRLVQSVNTKTAELLEDELNRATIVKESQFKEHLDFVIMNSVVSFIDLENNIESTVELVYPNEISFSSLNKKVSILAPVGAALIGLHLGQNIEWPLPTGKTKHLKVVSITLPSERLDVA